MDDVLERGARWLAEMLREYASVSVAYARPSTGEAVTLRATPDAQVLRVTDRMGDVRVVRSRRDYVFRASDLVLGGAVVTPRRGDVITEGDMVWEVSPIEDEPEWRYEDSRREVVRVRTKER